MIAYRLAPAGDVVRADDDYLVPCPCGRMGYRVGAEHASIRAGGRLHLEASIASSDDSPLCRFVVEDGVGKVAADATCPGGS